MDKMINGWRYQETLKGPLVRACAHHNVLARLGDKWTILVISNLAVSDGRRSRFSTLENGIEGITRRMLTLTLRNLERDGLVLRHSFPEVPPRVEYELTEMGAGILPALEGFTAWIGHHWPRIETCRNEYDTAQE